MHDKLPPAARTLGLAGLIPFLMLSAATWLTQEPWSGGAAFALMGYGAVIASFLGAVHWGLALRACPDEEGAAWWRFGLGVVPSLIAWGAALLPTMTGLLVVWEALVVLALLLVAIAAVETQAARRGLLPLGYLRLRWQLSLGASACLVIAALA
ncbi:DUF3429 domain-containing protein [Mesorhizobium liriopis]|uniref:DUF3429 domain-containing protein n=1 Tax=Mesorhizobium liriopis TaxID=2953882 RepID=UPI00338D4561